MNKEIEVPHAEYAQLAGELASTFIQRRDLYPCQMDDGSYICIRKPLNDWHLIAHLKGEITLGAYVLDPESQARFIAIDADNEPQMDIRDLNNTKSV